MRVNMHWGVLIFLMFVAGCTGEPDTTASKSYTVEIRQMKFEPAELRVEKGDTVIFVNNDFVLHDITDAPGRKWSSGPLEQGASWQLVANESADYFCSLHQVMKGRIVVER